jgi:hypothetical protein
MNVILVMFNGVEIFREMMAVTGTAFPSGTPEFTLVF